jgi:hypothetical protein
MRSEFLFEALDLFAECERARTQQSNKSAMQVVLDRRVLTLQRDEAHRTFTAMCSSCRCFQELPQALSLACG